MVDAKVAVSELEFFIHSIEGRGGLAPETEWTEWALCRVDETQCSRDSGHRSTDSSPRLVFLSAVVEQSGYVVILFRGDCGQRPHRLPMLPVTVRARALRTPNREFFHRQDPPHPQANVYLSRSQPAPTS
ncbi:hypothetical protein RSAG8_06798, partial [Rhizoctonia solani AG-8 WAC10335]